jgi:hypothetical protein
MPKPSLSHGPDILNDHFHILIGEGVRAGVSPDKIYAMIKTGRILTRENMKLLHEGRQEWQDACLEYDRLAGTRMGYRSTPDHAKPSKIPESWKQTARSCGFPGIEPRKIGSERTKLHKMHKTKQKLSRTAPVCRRSFRLGWFRAAWF